MIDDAEKISDDLGKISDREHDMIRAHREEQSVIPSMKQVRETILKNMVQTSKYTDKNGKDRISNKVDMKQFSQLLNQCDSESTVKFNYNWKGGLFVDYGSS